MSVRVGSIVLPTRQGIGWLAKRFFDAGVITDVMAFRGNGRKSHLKEWYPPGTVELVGRPFDGPDVEAFVGRIDVLLQFETVWDHSFFRFCRGRGVKTVVVPNHEWLMVSPPFRPDAYIAPSLLDQQYLPGSPFLEIPVEGGTWRQRTRAVRFLHGAGNLGVRFHKGTPEILAALRLCRTSVDFTIRAQDVPLFNRVLAQAGWPAEAERIDLPGGGTLTLQRGDGEHAELYAHHDVFVMAEKYNGLSLPLREARAAGMLVVTSSRFPMNTWLPREPLIPVHRLYEARVSGAYLPYQEAEVRPEDIAATIDRLNGSCIEQYSREGRAWAEEMSWERWRPKWKATLEEVARS
jgi:hypothetical protein